MSIYRFPAMAKLREWTAKEQFKKIVSEVKEVKSMMYRTSCASHNLNPDDEELQACFTDYGMEILDVIHACETLLRMEFTEAEVEELRGKVIEKNARRGYYGWCTR